MKTFAILCLVFAMAHAQNRGEYTVNGVNVVDRPRPDGGAVSNPDPSYYQQGGQGSQVIISNPDPGFYVDPYQYQQYPGSGGVVIQNPDPFFAQGGQGGQGGYQQPDIGPAYVQPQYPAHLQQKPGNPYPYHPGARGGNQ